MSLVAPASLCPEAAEDGGRLRREPDVAITPMPASTIARARRTDEPPRSSLTTSAPPSLTSRIAFLTASSSEVSYEPNGMSPTMIGL